MTSTVRNMDLEGVPLRRTLQLLLDQIDLAYFVQDGLLFITSKDAGLSGLWRRRSPSHRRSWKGSPGERGELSVTETQELLELLKTRGRS